MVEQHKQTISSRYLGIGMTSPRTRSRLVNRLRAQGIGDEAVLAVINDTPRHIFVEEALASHAYEDTSLPVGYGQTISRPYTVARMTEILLRDGLLQNVLEIGTGCGYQTTILAQLVEQVYTMERISHLLHSAKSRFRELGLRNINARHGDGYQGWSCHAPFQGILVTAAPERMPSILIQQLEIGGCMVLPIGPKGQQVLVRVVRTERGYETEIVETAAFVPLCKGVY